jgi:phage shock protein PspC (stress-responsive transcriptional regulator)
VSDAPASFEASPAESGPAESGQTEYSPDQSEAPQPAEPEYLDIDDSIAGRHVRVKVDGEEISVPLSEALQGYQRQAAFTRHSQQLAEQRREAEDAIRLHQAMQQNPGLTMQVLANRAGMTVEQYLGLTPQQQAAAVAEQETEYDDPLEREIAMERQARQALEQRIAQREADEQLRGVVYGLQQQYGLNEDQIRAVVGQTMQMGLGIDFLPVVYQAMAFQAQQQAWQETATQQQATTAERQAAAAQAAAVVGNGTGVNGGSPTPANPKYSSYREAITAAFDEVEARNR